MAFPTVVTTNTGVSDSSASTTHTANLPASLVSGNLLLIIIGGGSTAPTGFSASGWTFLTTSTGSSANLTLAYKTSTGSEGATVTITTSNSPTGLMFNSYQISGWSGTPEQATASTGASGSGDPPNMTPSWGAQDTLWIAAMTDGSSSGISAAPTNYTNLITFSTSGPSRTSGTARRQLNASSENPGTFTSTSGAWLAQTYAIKPAPVAIPPLNRTKLFLSPRTIRF